MERTPQECFEKLLNAYSHNYDLTRDVETEEGGSFPAMAHYFLRDEHYLVRRDKQFYATEQHDYTYFHVADHLDAAGAKALTERTLKAGLAAIHPHKEHMSSFVTLVVLAETIDPEAKKVLKKTRFHKNYRLALHGWMEYHIAAMECSTRTFLSNPAGRGARKTLEANFGPKLPWRRSASETKIMKEGECFHERISTSHHQRRCAARRLCALWPLAVQAVGRRRA